MARNKKFYLLLAFSFLLLLIGIYFALTLGATEVSISDVWDSIFHYKDNFDMQLIRDVRLPRVIATILVGGLLGICGAMMQGVTRNPLAEPSIMGISQGATLAITFLYINASWVTSNNIIVASLVGALLSGLLIILFTTRKASNNSISKLLLAGTALSSFFVSLSTMIGLLTNNSQMIAFFVAGGFRNVTWLQVIVLLVTAILGFISAILLAPKINAVSLGDDIATGLGVNPSKIRFITLLLIIPLCAISVSVARSIAFVGLIIPQIAKQIIGHNYRLTIPASFVLGAVLLVFADSVARLINAPYETSIGIFTALIGVPFFIYLIRKEQTK